MPVGNNLDVGKLWKSENKNWHCGKNKIWYFYLIKIHKYIFFWTIYSTGNMYIICEENQLFFCLTA